MDNCAKDLSVTERREVTALLAPIWRAKHLRAAIAHRALSTACGEGSLSVSGDG